MSHLDPVPDLIAAAATSLACGDIDSARAEILKIDQTALVAARAEAQQRVWGPGGPGAGLKKPAGQERQPVSPTKTRAVFRRDHFVCRYAHCRRRTIDADVLRAVSQALPDLMPYHPHWKQTSSSIVYWIYTTSLEHRVSFPLGGSSEESNLLTTCYACNDLKNWLDADVLGWTVAPPDESAWDGLEGLLPQLRRHLRQHSSQRGRSTSGYAR